MAAKKSLWIHMFGVVDRLLGMNELVPIQNSFSIPSFLNTDPSSYHIIHRHVPFVQHVSSLSFFLASLFRSLPWAQFNSTTNIAMHRLPSVSLPINHVFSSIL
jgi:hypothetical protein